MSEEHNILNTLRKDLGSAILKAWVQRPRRINVRVKQGLQRRAIKTILGNIPDAILSTITAVDMKETFELNYHMWCRNVAVTIRTEVPKKKPETETITDMIPGASFYEREVYDLFGIKFKGHPYLKRLLLPDDWPEGQHPLRKDWKAPEDISLRNSLEEPPKIGNPDSKDASSIINIVVGPQHPALHEPERFLFKLDGETVIDVETRIGYVHRGIEKAAESLMFFQDVHLVERICGICNVAHTVCFCQAVEEIGRINVPPRANYLRIVIAELNRIHSHLLLLGVAGLEIGFETLFQYIWRDREIVLDLVEMITGNRIMAEYNTIGGVRRDITQNMAQKILSKITTLKKRASYYKEIFESDPTIELRTKKVGELSREKAIKLCVVGPVARGSGVDTDVRRDDPYAAYGEVPFKVPVYNDCDVWSRLMVRVDEVLESIEMIEYAVKNMPGGPFRVRVARRQPEGESLSRVEAPRGELLHYVKSNGSAYPERVKVRTPTLANIISFGEMVKGCYVADIPAILISLDPCFACTDRVALMDVNVGEKWSCSLSDLRNGEWRKKRRS
ncbi:NADH-quinone oxidoreductase subunit D [Candidatus Bathyarchaeota archaeon]|nr:MAG: NADH-quinone oxidoreductase subunit D [Candidatus Bathyarchaeota archaeon]